MIRKKICFAAIVLALSILLNVPLAAQNYTDALRYSSFDFKGTARSLGINGSMSALGADFSAISVNPAGLAVFRSSAITISPAFYSNRIESRLAGEGNMNSETIEDRFELPSIGVVFGNQPIASDWKTANFGISLQQLGNFHGQFTYEGNSIGSIVDRFQELANNFGLDDFESGLAFDAQALYDIENDGRFESDVELNPNANLFRTEEVITEGSMNELQITIGGNLKEQLYLGLAVGITTLEYSMGRTYTEEDPNDEIDFFQIAEFREQVTTQGNGVNVKLGAIYRANQMLRFGAAVHTPTAWRLDEFFTSDFFYQFDEDGETFANEVFSPEGVFDYKVVTPWRFIGSTGIILQKSGFISAEIEYLNYGGAKLKFDDFPDDEAFVNEEIGDFLGSAINLRVGGEYAYNSLRFRLGGGIQTSPFQDDSDINYSFGFGGGFRAKQFFVSLGYNYFSQNENYLPYIVSNAPLQEVNNNITRHRVALTGGVRF